MWRKSLKPRASAWNMSFIFEWVTFTAKLHNESLHSKDNNIFFYSKHIIYQLLFKIYWLGSWFCRKCVTKSTQALSVEMRQLGAATFLQTQRWPSVLWKMGFYPPIFSNICSAPEVSGGSEQRDAWHSRTSMCCSKTIHQSREIRDKTHSWTSLPCIIAKGGL